MKLTLHPVELLYRHVFRISSGARDRQSNLIVELSDGALRGFGETVTSPYYGTTVADHTAAIESVRGELEAWDGADPEGLYDRLAPRLSDHPFCLCALDEAAWDLHGKRAGLPLHALWGLDPARGPLSDYTLSIDTIETMLARLDEKSGWPCYKIKLGTEHDLEIVRALRRRTDVPFRVDVNCGWTAEQTLRYAPELKALGVEFLEQPLPAEDVEGQEKLFRECPLELIADESCVREDDVAEACGRFHGINVKLFKCGGLTPARRMLAHARRLGKKTMVGCMSETSVGISAIAHLLGLLDYVDMDGSLFLANDPARGVRLEQGRAIFPDVPGTGAELL